MSWALPPCARMCRHMGLWLGIRALAGGCLHMNTCQGILEVSLQPRGSPHGEDPWWCSLLLFCGTGSPRAPEQEARPGWRRGAWAPAAQGSAVQQPGGLCPHSRAQERPADLGGGRRGGEVSVAVCWWEDYGAGRTEAWSLLLVQDKGLKTLICRSWVS